MKTGLLAITGSSKIVFTQSIYLLNSLIQIKWLNHTWLRQICELREGRKGSFSLTLLFF